MEKAHSLTEGLCTLRGSNPINMFVNRKYLLNGFYESHRVIINSKLNLNGFFRVINIVSLHKLSNFIKSRLHHKIIRNSFSLILPKIDKFRPIIAEICNDYSKYLRKTHIRIYSILDCSCKSLSFSFVQLIEISSKRKRNRRLFHNFRGVIEIEVIPTFIKAKIIYKITILRV
jgi:hypothetical protein